MDTATDGWGAFEFVKQLGRDTGNAELQDYIPEQCQIRDGKCFLVLAKRGDRWVSGKLRTKLPITHYAREGMLEVTCQGPNPIRQGSWPAVWLLPNGPGWPHNFGEVDLAEVMAFRGDEKRAFSTLHFGDRPGHDYTPPGHWGLSLGTYEWGQGDHILRFYWEKDGAWNLSLTVDGVHVWAFATKHQGPLDVHEPGFRRGEPGDPAALFQAGFDQGVYHLILNYAMGGRPFRSVDHGLDVSDFVVSRVRIVPK